MALALAPAKSIDLDVLSGMSFPPFFLHDDIRTLPVRDRINPIGSLVQYRVPNKRDGLGHRYRDRTRDFAIHVAIFLAKHNSRTIN
jgi:hypothetical protein